MLSQQRGPTCARIYAEAKKQQQAGDEKQQQAADAKQQQKVLVLRDGWKGFSSKFKADPQLVKNFNQDEQWES